MRRALLLPLLAGCKQVFGLDEPAHQGDAAVDAPDVMADAPPDAQRPCVDRWAAAPTFSAPSLVSELSTTLLESDPSITADGRTIYFQRNSDIYVSQRATVNAAWGTAVVEPMLSSSAAETKVSITSDQTRAYIATSRGGGEGGYDIWRGRRDQATDPWTLDSTFLANVNTTESEHDPHINLDWRRLYLAVIVAPNSQRIAVASRLDATRNYDTPVVITELERPASQADPSLTSDERVIVFTSTESGKRRLVYATRATAAGAFSTPQELTALNADIGLGDSDPMISGDGCLLYWSSTRTGDGDIYVAQLQ